LGPPQPLVPRGEDNLQAVAPDLGQESLGIHHQGGSRDSEGEGLVIGRGVPAWTGGVEAPALPGQDRCKNLPQLGQGPG
jgi:hypothetical protein